MELTAAQSLYEQYKLIYEEKEVKNRINEEKYFLNSLEVVHLHPFTDTSYDVVVYAIKDGKVIEFKLLVALNLFGKSL